MTGVQTCALPICGGIDLVGVTPIVSGNTSQIQYRWQAIGDAIYALPDPFQDMLEGAPMVIGQVVRNLSVVRRSLVSGIFAGRQCHPPGNPADSAWSDGISSSNAFDRETVVDTVKCQVLTSGSVSPDPIPAGTAGAVDAVGDPDPDARCYDGPAATVALSVAATTTPAISVPLVDLVETPRITPP